MTMSAAAPEVAGRRWMLAFLVVQNIVAGTGIIFGFPSLAVMLPV